MNLLQFTQKGIYCEQADVYIDPWRPVNKALITHGHSDHARRGHKHYICVTESVPILKLRLGKHINVRGVPYGEKIQINGVHFSFIPAGHIVGSAQVRAEYKGEIWVVSGDYKLQDDQLSKTFEPVSCHHFITETTFGLPVYKWKPQKVVFDEIYDWWKENRDQGKVTVLAAYALGKAQRLIQNLHPEIEIIYTHGAVENINEVLRSAGTPIRKTTYIQPGISLNELQKGIIIAAPSAIGTPWMKQFKDYSLGMASGWMAIRGMRRRRGADRGFVLSDHCDWDGLNKAIRETGAEYIYPTHGYTEIFKQYLEEQGFIAKVVNTEFESESIEPNSNAEE